MYLTIILLLLFVIFFFAVTATRLWIKIFLIIIYVVFSLYFSVSVCVMRNKWNEPRI